MRFAIISPLSRPTKAPAIILIRQHFQSDQPFVNAKPKDTAPKVMVELTDRSIPAVKTVKVWPTTMIVGIAAATKILFKFQSVKNSAGAIRLKKPITKTNAATTNQSDQKKGSLNLTRRLLIKFESDALDVASASDLLPLFFTYIFTEP